MSGSPAGTDFVWYSLERTNPGDEVHPFPIIYKSVSGMDKQTLESLSELYGLVTNVYQAPDIKTAGAATGHSKNV